MTDSVRSIALRIVLGVLCVYHLGIGLLSCLAPDTTLMFAESFYGIHVDDAAAQFTYMLKALGMYALFTGGLLTLAFTDPKKYRHVILAAAALLAMRATTRILFYDTLNEAFAVSWSQNLFSASLLVLQGSVLLWATSAVGKAAPRVAGLQPVLPRDVLASASRRLNPAFASASGTRS